MEPQRWRAVERLYPAALARAPADRAAFLAEACAGDDDLRQEISSLLALDPSSGSFLNRRIHEQVPSREHLERAVGLPFWARLVVVAAAVRSAAALMFYLSLWGSPTTVASVPPRWLYALLATTFTTLGIGLTFGNKHDRRAGWLGGLFVLVAAALITPLVQTADGPRLEWLEYLRPDAFQAAFLWYFVAQFPSELEHGWARTLQAVASLSALIAAWCVALNLAAVWLPSEDWPRWIEFFLITTTQPGRTYWLVVFGMTLPALPVLMSRALKARGEARKRATIFVSGLLAGTAPFTFEVLLEEIFPSYKVWAHQPGVEPWIGAVIFGALAVVPFITTYSVLFDHVVEVRVVLRTALQYVLARYTIFGATLVPFVALGLYLFDHREEPIASLVTGTRPVLLGGFVVLGIVVIRLRTRWLNALDRRYFREPYDARDIVTRMVGEWQPTTSAALASDLRQEIDHALHSAATLFVVDETRTSLQDPEAQFPPLALSSTVVQLAIADPRPMDVDVKSDKSALSRLPLEERRWLEMGRFSLLFAVKRSDGTPLGLLALTAKRSDLPYSTEDRRLLMAIASTAATTLDRLRSPGPPESPADPPARECASCGRISTFDAAQCTCGGQLVIAFVPLTLRGIFRFDQRIGAGGMGVVYKATDLNLHRDVAIKALPRATREMVSRLRREARAMAAVTHHNLAIIHGVETWQGTPLIVQEYLSGGTLASRLAAQQMSIPDILDLGITLAEVLHHLHANGVIHCDIKPSNLGFTDQGVVKVLDFGLARIVHEARVATSISTQPPVERSAAAWELSGGWFGTPHFMSPEAALGQKPSPSFDLWALAVVLFEAVAGRRPFEGESAFQILARIVNGPTPDIRTIRPDTPAPVAAFFEAALAHDPALRPADGSVLAREIRGLRAMN